MSQLTKHSEGAIDARSLLGPKMRAAGFVTLPHTLGSRSDLSKPGTPSSPTLMFPVSGQFPPTPSDPPNFPPIVFLDPSAVTTMDLWEYQREGRWRSLPSSSTSHGAPSGESNVGTASNEPTPGPGGTAMPSFFSSPATHRPGVIHQSSSSSSNSSGLPSSSGSSSTLVSSGSTPSSGLSSVEESDERSASHEGRRGKGEVEHTEPSEYPFPSTFDYTRPPRSRGSRASSATASPTIYAGPASALLPSSHYAPAVPSPSSTRQDSGRELQPPSPRRRRTSNEKHGHASIKNKPAVEPTPSFATARRPQNQRQYSLTELCDSSPFAWVTTSDIFVPPAPIQRAPIRKSSVVPLSLAASISKPRAVIEPPPHRRHHTAPEKIPTMHPERHHRIVSAPLRLPASAPEPNSSGMDGQKSNADRATRARDRVQHASGDDPSHGASDVVEAHRSCDGPKHGPAQPSNAAGAAIGSGSRGRGRDTRGKSLGASETVEERAAAVGRADRDEGGTKEDGLAGLVLAHKERDREYARHVAADRERDRLVKQKLRAHHKLRGKLVQDEDPSESDATMVDQHLSVAKAIG
ncbi:hypothetical protein BD413DRAFT_613007 [Trametes elegans]|nr:hypothetical protein BD413DRAFT_613007 [Trametes elegans]